MALETGDFIGDLSPADPPASDPKSQGDDHLRLIKKVVQQSFAGFDGAVMVLGTEAQGGSANQFDVTIGAPVTYDDPFIVVFQATHTHSGYPEIQVNGLGYKNLQSFDSINLSGGAIRSGAIVAALWNGTVFRIISAVEAARRYGETYFNTHNFGGATLIAPTPSANNHATTKQYVDTTIAASASTKVSKAGDTYTGNHDASGAASFTVPDRSLGDNSSNAANTKYVDQTAFSMALPSQAGNAGKTLLTDGTDASWGHDATKADKAGEVYSGTHNFTGATITVPTAAVRSSSDDAASLTFVREQPNWEITDITTATYTLPGNRRGEMFVCGGSTTTVTLPAPTGRYFVRVHNPNPASVTISAGTGRTVNGSSSVSLPPGSSVTITRDGATSNYRAFFFNVGGGGGGLPYDTYQDFLTSGTFTVQKTGWHRVTIVGAGGSGGSYQTTSTGTNQAAVAAGGGAGGIATTELILTQGTNYTVTIGAGGASVTGTNNGNAGGTTTITGSGLSMTANGGGGGESAGINSGDVSAAGGAGGTASTSVAGETYTGGAGGNASASGSGGQASRAGGGGGPNILALTSPPNGGPASRNRSGTVPRTGGGASVGGSGSFADGSTTSAAGPMLPVPPAEARPTSLPLDDWRLGYPVRGNTPVIGDGRGLGSVGTDGLTNPTPAQAFGGGGGITTDANMNAPSGGIGAGGGGRAVVAAAGTGRPSGAGGDGLAIFEWIA